MTWAHTGYLAYGNSEGEIREEADKNNSKTVVIDITKKKVIIPKKGLTSAKVLTPRSRSATLSTIDQT